jgi:hypothetical protein
MNAVPLELPLKPSEAAALADLIFKHVDGRAPTDDLRGRLAGRLLSLGLSSIRAFAGSLAKDPIHHQAYFIAVDAVSSGEIKPLLLHMALASSPANALFPDSILIGRMRPGGGREIVVNAIPFHATDHGNIATFVEKIDPTFLPRPQGIQSALAVISLYPDVSIPAAFEAYRQILKSRGGNLASPTGTPNRAGPGSLQHMYFLGLWSAIRAGWREGYTAQAPGISVRGTTEAEIASSMEAANEVIRQSAAYTKFAIDTTSLVNKGFSVPAESLRAATAEFSRKFSVGERSYSFSEAEVASLASRFGRGLLVIEKLYNLIQSRKAAQSSWKQFDFELLLQTTPTATTANELLFHLHWLKFSGRSVQLIAPNFGSLESLGSFVESLAELSAIARHYNATLSFPSGLSHRPDLLQQIGRATGGRFNLMLSEDLEWPLFDVLAGQPSTSPYRQLFDRLVARQSAPLPESAPSSNPMFAASLSREVGNLDIHSPDRDTRTFREKFEELPDELAREVSRRITQHLIWVAENLRA